VALCGLFSTKPPWIAKRPEELTLRRWIVSTVRSRSAALGIAAVEPTLIWSPSESRLWGAMPAAVSLGRFGLALLRQEKWLTEEP
jgi:hypothetical protein